jgi:hypothetical protein
VKLKWYSGAIHCHLPGYKYGQRHVTVVATSRKRVRELLLPLEPNLSQYYVNGWFCSVDAPPTRFADKPVEEAVWIEPEQHAPPIRWTPS